MSQRRQLIPEEVRRILKMWREGISLKDIAAQMGRSYSCIQARVCRAKREA
jgi:DNA-binding NarL/FixJ family response regulator